MENCEVLGFKEVSVILRIFRKRVKNVEGYVDDLKDDLSKKNEPHED